MRFWTVRKAVLVSTFFIFHGAIAFGTQATQTTQEQDSIELEGLSFSFDSKESEKNPILEFDHSHLRIDAPIKGNGSPEIENAIVFAIPPESLPPSASESRGLRRWLRARGIGKETAKTPLQAEELPFAPEDASVLEVLRRHPEGDVTSFLVMYKRIMDKASYLLAKAKLPESESKDLLRTLSQYLWSGASTMITANARSSGVDVMLYGGAGSSRIFSRIITGLIGKMGLRLNIPESHAWLFSGTAGVSLFRYAGTDGRKRSFIQVPVNYQRSKKMRTFAGIGGYEVYLTRTWQMGVTEESKSRQKDIETIVLGALGTISRGEGLFSVSLNMGLILPFSYFVGAGGLSFPPVVGALSVYDTDGKRKAILNVPLDATRDRSVLRRLGDVLMNTKRLFVPQGERLRTCGQMFTAPASGHLPSHGR